MNVSLGHHTCLADNFETLLFKASPAMESKHEHFRDLPLYQDLHKQYLKGIN